MHILHIGGRPPAETACFQARYDEGRHLFEVPAFMASVACLVFRGDVIILDLAGRDALCGLRERRVDVGR